MPTNQEEISLEEVKNDKKIGQAQYVVFNIGDEEYGIEIGNTREIIKSAQITNVPNSAEHVLGVINLRGIIVPVIDLHTRFEISGSQSKFDESESRIITIEVNDMTLGIHVDFIEGIVWLDEGKITTPPETEDGIRKDFLKGVCPRDENQLLILLDIEKTLFA